MGTVWGWIVDGIAYLIGALKVAIGTLFGRLLGAFGLTMMSLDVVLPPLKNFVLQYVSAMPAEAMNFLGYLGVGTAMSMIFSALSVTMAARVLIVPKSVATQIEGAMQ